MRVQTLIATTSDTALFRIGGQYPDLRLSDLPKKLSQDVGLHPSLHHLKVYDLAQAPAAFPIAYADWQNSIAQVEEAEIALKSITKPAVLQPKGSGLFDGLKAQVDASADEEQYQQILVDAQARVKALKDTIQAKKEVAIALGHYADIYGSRKRLQPKIDKYNAQLEKLKKLRASVISELEAEKEAWPYRNDSGYLPNKGLDITRVYQPAELPDPWDTKDFEGEREIIDRPLEDVVIDEYMWNRMNTGRTRNQNFWP